MFTNQIKIKLIPRSCSFVQHLHQQFSGHRDTDRQFLPADHVYQKIYKWSHLDQFADNLLSKILYVDNDIVCLAKPFGVGIYNPYDKSNKPDKIEPKMFGDPRYCINDAMNILANKLKTPFLSISLTEDRILSGIVVLAKTQKGTERVKRSINESRKFHLSPFTFHCLTYGAPMMKEPIVEEVVAIEEICVNSKTGEKEPEIVYNPSKSLIRRGKEIRRVKTVLKVLDYNSSLNVALVELKCSRTNYHFVRCYLSSKACFILGDPRFSRRVGHVLGVPYTLRSTLKRPREEPLPNQILRILNVKSNKSIPLMLHQVKLTLSNYTKNTAIEIDNYNYPEHFIWSIQKLFGTNINSQ